MSLIQIPITFAEIFASFVREGLQSTISPYEDWDNISWRNELGSGLTGADDEKVPTASVDACAIACQANVECLQYVHDGDTCFLGKAIRLGERREPEKNKQWRSGWHQGRIEEWISKQALCDIREFPASLERVEH